MGCTPTSDGGGDDDDAMIVADGSQVSDMMPVEPDNGPAPDPDGAPPVQDAAPPTVDAVSPPRDASPPPVDAAPPAVDAAPPPVDAAPPPMENCRDPRPVLGQGQPTGLVQCADQSMNRVEPVQCQPLNMGNACPPGGNEHGEDQCLVDADCDARPNGRCIMAGGVSQMSNK